MKLREEIEKIITEFECELPDECNFTAGYALGKVNVKEMSEAITKHIVDKLSKPYFESWLMQYHAEQNPEILDDMLPDCFNDWVVDLDVDDWIRLGDRYLKERIEE